MSLIRTSVLLVTRGDDQWDRYVPQLFSQSRAPDEVLVVIDRPTTKAEQKALTAAHPKVTFIFNTENIGLTRSLNIGLSKARGDIIFRTDDDDMSRADRIERQLREFETTGADLVCSWAEGVLDEPGAAPWMIRCPADDAGLKAALLKRNVIVHASLAFRKDVILAMGGYDETYRYAQDYDLYLRAVRKGLTFAGVAEPLVRRTYAPTSITLKHRYNQMMFSCAARIVHCAATGDVRDFLRTIGRYGLLAATPPFMRRWRRRLFQLVGRGA